MTSTLKGLTLTDLLAGCQHVLGTVPTLQVRKLRDGGRPLACRAAASLPAVQRPTRTRATSRLTSHHFPFTVAET